MRPHFVHERLLTEIENKSSQTVDDEPNMDRMLTSQVKNIRQQTLDHKRYNDL
jgi:hypothetical protein